MHPHVSQHSMHPVDSQSHGDVRSQDFQGGSGQHAQNIFESSSLAKPPERNIPRTELSGPSLLLGLEYAGSYTQAPTFPHQGAPFPSISQVWEARQPQDPRSIDLERPPEQHVEQQLEGGNFSSGHMPQEYYTASTDLGEHTGNEGMQPVADANFVSSFPNDQQVYPLPIANHASVVEDKHLFMHCLEGFLAALGTRLTVPKINGSDLDLHLLYKELTARGGLEQVIRYKKWKEISDAMNILQNYPGASFVLRRHYLTFLYHFEQAYYFGVQEQLLPPPASLPAPIQLPSQGEAEASNEISTEPESMFKKRKRKTTPTHIFGVDPAAAIGSSVTGAINGKFEAGYVVTVVVGGERLTGVIYHVASDSDVQQFAYVPGLLNDLGSELEVPGLEVQLHGRKKRESTYKKDPNAPRRTRTGYNIFYKEQRARMRQLYPEKDKKVSRMVIEMWSKLSQEEKSLYLERSQQDKERYRQEMLEYEERLKVHSQVGGGTNVSEEQELCNYDGSHDYHVTLDPTDLGLQLSHSQVLGSEAHYGDVLPEHGYHMQDDELAYIPQAHIPDSEIPGGFEQVYEIQEAESDFPEDEESTPHSEEPYNPDVNEIACSRSDLQHPETHFVIPQPGYQMFQEEVVSKYPPEKPVRGSGGHDTTATSLRSHNELEHFYVSPHKMHLPNPNMSVNALPAIMHPVSSNVYQNKSEFLNGLVPEQHYNSQQGYAYASFPVAPESSATSEQARTEQDAPFPRNPQQHNQVLQFGEHGGQVYLQQTHQEGQHYPMHLPASQAYSLPGRQPYPVHFPPGHALSLHLSDTQAVQYTHELAPGLHKPQAHRFDVLGGSASPRQAYHSQDTRH